MSVVRVRVRLQVPSQPPEYLTFLWNLFNAPSPQIGDELCFGDYLMEVKNRRYDVPSTLVAPTVILHTGITGRRARVTITRAELTEILNDYPTVEVIG